MNQNMCAFQPEEIILENFFMGDHWGIVELIKDFNSESRTLGICM